MARTRKLDASDLDAPKSCCNTGCNCAELTKRIEALESALEHIKKTSIWNSKWD